MRKWLTSTNWWYIGLFERARATHSGERCCRTRPVSFTQSYLLRHQSTNCTTPVWIHQRSHHMPSCHNRLPAVQDLLESPLVLVVFRPRTWTCPKHRHRLKPYRLRRKLRLRPTHINSICSSRPRFEQVVTCRSTQGTLRRTHDCRSPKCHVESRWIGGPQQKSLSSGVWLFYHFGVPRHSRRLCLCPALTGGVPRLFHSIREALYQGFALPNLIEAFRKERQRDMMEFCFFHRESEHLCLGRCVLFVPLLSCLSVALVLTVASLRVIYLFVIFEIHSLHVNLYPFFASSLRHKWG